MNFDFSALNFETIDSNINAYPDIFLNQNGVTITLSTWAIPPLFCVCWMRKRGYLRSVPARATSRRASSFPSREANRKVLLLSPTRICLTRFALSPARTGFPARVTRCVVSGLLMQKPCALTSMKGSRRTFALLRRAMTQNNP
jgi:hypothetical protein